MVLGEALDALSLASRLSVLEVFGGVMVLGEALDLYLGVFEVVGGVVVLGATFDALALVILGVTPLKRLRCN